MKFGFLYRLTFHVYDIMYVIVYIIFARATYTPLGGGRVAPGSVRGVRSDKGPWPAAHATLNAAINLISNGPAAATDSIAPVPVPVDGVVFSRPFPFLGSYFFCFCFFFPRFIIPPAQ